jgi:hypothetical protein
VSNNPLKEFYTQTGIYVTLPSEGRFYKSPVKTSADGDIEVLPMNAVDEMQFQNPDGLLNNESLIKVLERVVPGISNPREITKPDLDVLLIALRIVTYGKDMDVNTKCTKCNHEAVYAVDLQNILSSAKKISKDNVAMVGELKVYVKPFTIVSQNKLNEYLINIQRTARKFQKQSSANIDDTNVIEEMKAVIGKEIRESAIELFNIAGNLIEKIELPNGEIVENREFINEWLDNVKAPDYKNIREKINELSKEVINREFKYTCAKCETPNTVEVNFDPANFFGLS